METYRKLDIASKLAAGVAIVETVVALKTEQEVHGYIALGAFLTTMALNPLSEYYEIGENNE